MHITLLLWILIYLTKCVNILFYKLFASQGTILCQLVTWIFITLCARTFGPAGVNYVFQHNSKDVTNPTLSSKS